MEFEAKGPLLRLVLRGFAKGSHFWGYCGSSGNLELLFSLQQGLAKKRKEYETQRGGGLGYICPAILHVELK